MPETEVRVVVARAHIEDAPEIENIAPREVRVRARVPLRVQYLFHVDESSRAKEAWRFKLQSQVGAHERAPIESNWNDRWGVPDRFWGTLEQTFRFDEPGTYAAGFKVHAVYDRAPWRGRHEGLEARREIAGTFTVTVEP